MNLVSDLKIPLLPYDDYISLGNKCITTMALKHLGLKKKSYPFDYISTHPTTILELLKNNFKNFYPLDLPENYVNGHYKNYCRPIGIEFEHFNKNSHAENHEMFNRRIKRLYDTIKSDQTILFIYTTEAYIFHKEFREKEQEHYTDLLNIIKFFKKSNPKFKFHVMAIHTNVKHKNNVKELTNLTIECEKEFISDKAESHIEPIVSTYRSFVTQVIRDQILRVNSTTPPQEAIKESVTPIPTPIPLSPTPPQDDKPKGEVDLCRPRLIKYCQGQGLDLGCGRSKISLNAIGIDLNYPEADMQIDARLMPQYPDGHFDFVFSSHLLEELENTEATLREWLRVIKLDGHIVLYQAEKGIYYPLGHPLCNKSHKHHFNKEDLWKVFEKIGGALLIHSADAVNPEWSFELVVKKIKNMIPDPIPVKSTEPTVLLKTEIPVLPKRIEPTFKFMVVGGPAENYIERCLASITNQRYTKWSAQVIIDPVGDKTYDRAIKFESDKMKIKLNETRQYNVKNFLDASKLLNPADEDIMIMVDADDWLAHNDVLSTLIKYYDSIPELLVTHGTWTPYPHNLAPHYRIPGNHNNRPYEEEEFRQNIRKFQWRGSHLKSFKHKVWKHLKEEDLKDANGDFITVTGDLALMWPLLEMAGFDRVKFVPEILYIYNMETPFNDDKVHLQMQMKTADYLVAKEPYKRLETF